MKKKYTKPEILFESFSMSERIAGDCEMIIDFARDVCGVKVNVFGLMETIVFTVGVTSQCNFFPSDDIHDGFCYHIPMETQNYFNS